MNEKSNEMEGNFGEDPWGKPYRFKVIHNSYGQPVYMLVLSLGPNESLDTPLEQLATETRKTAQVEFRGDDIGYLKSYR